MKTHLKWAQLSLDHVFMTHLPAFIELLGSGEITGIKYGDVWQQFKQELGNKTVWRGTMLTDEELAQVRTQGLNSPLSLVVQKSDQPKE